MLHSAEKIKHQRLLVEALRLRALRAATPTERADLNRELAEEAVALHRMTRVDPALELLSPEQVKARIVALVHERVAINQVLAQVDAAIRQGKGSSEARHRFPVQRSLLLGRLRLLERRLGLLRTGRDLEQPTWLHPSRVRVQRPKIGLPPLYHMPAPIEVVALIRAVAAGLHRKQGEGDRPFRARLKAYVNRALARYIVRSQVHRVPPEQALAEAVQETLTADPPALEAEADEGGVVADPVADLMASAVETPEAAAAVVAVTSGPGPSVDAVTAADVDKIVMAAETVEAQAAIAAPMVVEAAVPAPSAVALMLPAPVVPASAVEDDLDEDEEAAPNRAFTILLVGGVAVVVGILLFTRRG